MEKQPYVVFRKRHIFVLGKRRCFRKSVQFWKLSKTAKNGPHGRPKQGNGANHLGLPSDGAIGPSNSGPVDSQVAPITGPRPVIGPRAQLDSARASASRSPGY